MEYPEAQQVMARTLDEYDLIWFVTGGLPPNDPENTLERWLADNAYKAFDMWYGDFRLLAYGNADKPRGCHGERRGRRWSAR